MPLFIAVIGCVLERGSQVFERAETRRSVCLRQKILLYSEARDRDFGLQI